MAETNFDQFHGILLEASRNAFTNVQELHPDEHFYGFSLYHEPLWGYVIATANTEEGLTRAAEAYRDFRRSRGKAEKSIEELRLMLRWNSGDWEYHNTGPDFFEHANQWLLEQDLHNTWEREQQGKFDEEENWAIYLEQIDSKMIGICRQVLATCDREGVFSIVSDRDNVVVNIVMGDQDRSWIEHARILNPPEVYERWLDELKAANLH